MGPSPPTACRGADFFLQPQAINPAGAITGSFCCDGESGFGVHGFLRTPDGALTVLNTPGAVVTIPQAINPAGAITGLYRYGDGVFHGFLRLP